MSENIDLKSKQLTSSSSTIAQGQALHGLTSANLAKAVFKAELPEQVVRTLPAQSLYMAIRHNGFGSSTDLIEMVNIEQYRLFLDFDLWQADRFSEDNFWEWLQLSDEEQSIKLVQKLVKSIDLKLIALMIARYVDVIVPDEPQDMPPGPGFYTPDNGRTWIQLKLEDGNKHFLLGRLLAVVFETSIELFYQLLAVPAGNTESTLEEESYQERNKRLLAEGFPDTEYAAQLNSVLPQAQFLDRLSKPSDEGVFSTDLSPVQPLYSESTRLQPFKQLFIEVKERDALEEELTLVMNAALVFWKIDLFEYQAVEFMLQKVRGAINIGLEQALANSKLDINQVYSRIGVRGMYRYGLTQLLNLRNRTRKANVERIKELAENQIIVSLLACTREAFPHIPAFFNSDGSYQEVVGEVGKLLPGYRAIELSREIELISKQLSQHKLL